MSDEQLMDSFLAAVADLSDREAGNAVGLSHERVRQYRSGQWTRLHPKTRRAMEDYLAKRPPPDVDGYREGLRRAAEKVEMLAVELWEMAGVTRPTATSPDEAAGDDDDLEKVRRRQRKRPGGGGG